MDRRGYFFYSAKQKEVILSKIIIFNLGIRYYLWLHFRVFRYKMVQIRRKAIVIINDYNLLHAPNITGDLAVGKVYFNNIVFTISECFPEIAFMK